MQSCEKEYNDKVVSGLVTDKDTFLFAWYLIKSRYKNDVKKGLELMSGKIMCHLHYFHTKNW